MAPPLDRLRLVFLLPFLVVVTFIAGFYSGRDAELGYGLNWGLIGLVAVSTVGLTLRAWKALSQPQMAAPTPK